LSFAGGLSPVGAFPLGAACPFACAGALPAPVFPGRDVAGLALLFWAPRSEGVAFDDPPPLSGRPWFFSRFAVGVSGIQPCFHSWPGYGCGMGHLLGQGMVGATGCYRWWGGRACGMMSR